MANARPNRIHSFTKRLSMILLLSWFACQSILAAALPMSGGLCCPPDEHQQDTVVSQDSQNYHTNHHHDNHNVSDLNNVDTPPGRTAVTHDDHSEHAECDRCAFGCQSMGFAPYAWQPEFVAFEPSFNNLKVQADFPQGAPYRPPIIA